MKKQACTRYFGSNSGFSLLALTVSLLVMSISLMATLHLAKIGHSSQRQISAQNELTNVMKQVGQFLGSADGCKRYIEGKKINTTVTELSDQVVSGLTISYPEDQSKVFVAGGTQLAGGLRVNDVFLRNFAKLGANRYSARLVVSAGFPGSFPITRDVPLDFSTTTLDAATEVISGCSEEGQGAWVDVECDRSYGADGVYYCELKDNQSPEAYCKSKGYNTYSTACKHDQNGPFLAYGAFGPGFLGEGTLNASKFFGGKWRVSCATSSWHIPDQIYCLR